MSELGDLKRRLYDLERKVTSMVRVGVVSSVDREKCRVRVAFPGGMVSDDLPVMVRNSTADREYWMPSIEEQVTCVFLPNGPEIGFVLGSFYSDQDPIPDGAEVDGMSVFEFSDGARFEYSTVNSTLKIVIGDLEVEMTPDTIKIGGPGATQPFVRGTDYGTLYKAHTHPTGVGPSGPPANAAEYDNTLSEIITGR